MIVMSIRYIVLVIFIVRLTFYSNGQQKVEGSIMNNSNEYKIKIVIGKDTLFATLIDNGTTRDFISLLPLDLKLDDYAGTEKVSDLQKKLSTEDSPSGFDPSVGDITYYAPWENLAIFYKDFGYAKGLINLGKIDSGIEALKVPGSLNVRIELFK